MTENLRNVVLAGHGSSGKTSIAEIMLFKSGVTTRIGKVEEGNTVMDFEPEELKRKISISAAFHQINWKKHAVNLIDTPGDQNFFSDTKLCIQAADTALIVIDAIDGVKVQTEQAWNFVQRYGIPCFVFINKLDRERADFYKAIEDASQILEPKLLVTQLPIGKEASFSGIVDLISMQAYKYDEHGVSSKIDIPDDMIDDVNARREVFIEDVAEADDKLLEKYLEGEELSGDDIKNALRKGIKSRKFAPVLCGSAIANFGIGIDKLLDFIADYLPSPLHAATKTAVKASNKEKIEITPQDKTFSAFVFKTIADPYAGRLTIFKVVSGNLGADGTFFNTNKDCSERYNQLLTIEGKKQKPVEKAGPGDIVAVAKLKNTQTGDTLCEESSPIIFETASPLQPVISFAVAAKNQGDEDKIFTSLSKIMEEDMGLKLDRNKETKEILLSGCGQIHVEIALEKLKRKYNVEALLNIPKIPYKETIKKKVRVQGKHKKQSGGHGQYGDCWVTMEPLEKGKGFEFVDAIVGGAIPKTYIPAVERGIIEAAQRGVLAGYPCIDFRATLDDGGYHSVDSSEMAFKIAGSLAFKKAAEQANPVLLEPIMKITIITPDEYMGDIMGNLNSKRGRVLGMDSKGKNQVVTANVPMAEFQTYSSDLRSMTGGRGMFSMEFSHYDEVPAQESQRILDAISKEKE